MQCSLGQDFKSMTRDMLTIFNLCLSLKPQASLAGYWLHSNHNPEQNSSVILTFMLYFENYCLTNYFRK